jgi:hypothetical protein
MIQIRIDLGVVRGDSCIRPDVRLCTIPLGVFFAAFLSLALAQVGFAQAPLRPDQPYAEAALCARADVIFCEDFNYPQNFQYLTQYGLGYSAWINPGNVGGLSSNQVLQGGRLINSASTYPTKPQGAMPSGDQADSVWVGNWDATKGLRGDGPTSGFLRSVGGDFANGSPPTNDIYIRFQGYWTPNYAWPGDPKTDKYEFGAANPISNKILFVYPPAFLSPTDAAYDAGLFTSTSAWDYIDNARFADALIVRVGDAGTGVGFETFPMSTNNTYNPTHTEYAPYQSCVANPACTPYRDPHDTPLFGRIFRLDTDRWYTFELRYMLGSAPGARDGTVEVWIDGTKVYSANDLATCGHGTPADDCSGIGAIYIGAYHNSIDQTVWNGQQVIDNLIISRSYIGPPGSPVPSPPPPLAAPTPLAPTGTISTPTPQYSWTAVAGATHYKIIVQDSTGTTTRS